MATDFMITMEDRPGSLAKLGETMGKAGINIEGACAVTGGGKGEVHILVPDAAAARSALKAAGIAVAGEREVLVVDAKDRPGELGRITRKLADAGVNIQLFYISTGMKFVFAVDDPKKAKAAV
ncbi:MAG TPA: ACT domain-containing protein [Anaerolineales bacterium]